METLKDTPTTLMFHAEMIPPITDSVGDDVQKSCPPLAPTGELSSYSTFLDSRPPSFETYAIEEIVSLAHTAPGLHLHIVHLSATQAVPILRAARASGVNITAETCFHYLGLAADTIPDGDTRHKCCPPIREQTNQDGLWEELSAPDSVIRTVVSDHSPCTPELKLLPNHLVHQHNFEEADEGYCGCSSDEDESDDFAPKLNLPHNDSGVDVRPPQPQAADVSSSSSLARQVAAKALESQGDFFAAWGGISSVGLGLPILHTASAERAAAGEKVPSITDIVRLCSQATARQVGLSHRKGGLKVGLDADVCVFDDGEEWTLRTGDMRWKNRVSPWEGKRFVGRVRETWVRGRKVFEFCAGERGFVCEKPVGEAIVERRVI
jgi:allantoinase